MLTKQDKAKLRSMGQKLRPLFQIGKDGVTENLCNTLSDSLEAHELVKLNALKTCPVTIQEAAIDLAAATNSEIIQIIGKTVLLYRRSKKNKLEL